MILENTYSLNMVPATIEANASLDVLKEHFNNKGIYVRVYKELNLVLLKYKRKFCDITDEDVKRCRGLILDHTTYQPVCVYLLESLYLLMYSRKSMVSKKEKCATKNFWMEQ